MDIRKVLLTLRSKSFHQFRQICIGLWNWLQKLEDAPWPATKEELIDYAMRSGAPMEVVENLNELEDEGEVFETIEDVWPDYPTKEDFLFNEDEY